MRSGGSVSHPLWPARVACWAVCLLLMLAPATGSLAQDESGRDDPSPVAGHAEVIAHGVATMPGGAMVWRVETQQAALPNRAQATTRSPGFVLTDAGVVALVDEDGRLLTRVAPGEAAWILPERSQAVVSLEANPVPFHDITLVPASGLSRDGRERASDAVDLPVGRTFALRLIRDIVIRNEASDIAAGSGPALLLLTSGMVAVERAPGGGIDLAAGDVTAIEGDTIVTGASRAPASFVVALVGPEVPARVTVAGNRQPTVAPVLPASVTIASFICPVAYAGSDYRVDCVNPSSGIEFDVMLDDAIVQSALADADGSVNFTGISPADYVLVSGVPGDFASSRVRCLNSAGQDIARRHATNQIDISLASGDAIACHWYIVLENARGDDEAL
jgi:hypothetical protein